MQRLLGHMRRCIDDYSMISEGDKIAVGVSGGKDSLMLVYLMKQLSRFYPKRFELSALTLDMGLGMDFSGVERFCAELDVPYEIIRTDIYDIVFNVRKEQNPCSLCAKMRKGALNGALKERGCGKLALGHHFDDAVETMMMSLIFEGRLGGFTPVTYLSRMDVTQIRPMLYIRESEIISAAAELELPVVKNTCPADGYTRRQEVKELIAGLEEKYPDLRNKIFGAMQRYPLRGWEPGK
jgi:tRNA 2-thiocytidine biosynthesis protein TtcA